MPLVVNFMDKNILYNKLTPIILFLISIIIYSWAINNDFVWDSYGVFVDKNEVMTISDIPNIFLGQNFIGESKKINNVEMKSLNYYRPLTSLVHVIEHYFFGVNPFYYKVVNVVLNSVVVVLAYFLVASITGNYLVASISTLIYLSIPARSEVVYWAYSDGYIFMAITFISSFLFYLNKKYVPAFLLYASSLLFLESAIFLPFLMALHDFCYGKITKYEHYLKRYGMYLILTVLFLLIRRMAVGGIPFRPISGAIEILNVFAFVVFKHVKTFFHLDYPVSVYEYSDVFSKSIFWWPLFFLLLMFILLIYFFWCDREKAFWLLLFFICIPLVIIGGSDYVYAVKTHYLSSLGLAVILAIYISNLRYFAAFIVILFLSYNFFYIYKCDYYWENTINYVSGLVSYDKNFLLAQVVLGQEYLKIEKFDESINHFEKAFKLRPDIVGGFLYPISRAYFGKAYTFFSDNRYGESIDVLNSYLNSYGPNAKIYELLGLNYYRLGDYALSKNYFTLTQKIDPTDQEVRFYLKLIPSH